MSTDLAIREPQTVRLSSEQLQYISRTEFVPKQMRGNLPAILACVATGRELGLGDLSSLRSIHVIDGRPTFSAELMVSLVRKRGHSITGNFSGDSCTVTGTRIDNGDDMTVTWTVEMAKQAGLLGKDNWKKYTPAMLWARAVSQLCRMLFADCFAGGTYTPDEIETADLDFDTDSGPEPQAGEERPADAPRLDDARTSPSGPDPSASADPTTRADTPEPTEDLRGREAEGTTYASPEQRRLIFARAKEADLDEVQLRAIFSEQTGQVSSAKIPADRVEAVLEAVYQAFQEKVGAEA